MTVYILRSSECSCSSPRDVLAVYAKKEDADKAASRVSGCINGDRSKPVTDGNWVQEWEVE